MRASQLPTARRGTVTTVAPAATATRTGGSPLSPSGERVLQRYRLGRRLGTGAFGTVWAAYDERLDREVAVKILARERVLGGRFEREARAAARLTHPAIVTLYEASADDEGAYLVSELVQGQTLQSLLAQRCLSDRDVVAIAISVCDALEHAHARGVVHRDVKPANVLVPDRPSTATHPAKLTDFGVASVVGGDSLTRTGDVVGTAAYMAPEQAEGREAGASADLWALALVTYEALTGVNPARRDAATLHTRRLATYLPPLRRRRRDLPRELGRAIDLALRPRPRERGSVQELRAGLLACLPHLDDTPGLIDDPPARRPGGNEGARKLDTPGGVLASESFAPVAAPAPVAPASAPVPGMEREEVLPAPPQRWPLRALAACAAGLGSGWLAARLLGGFPTSPATIGLLAAALVLVLPRAGWMVITTVLTVGGAVQGHAGAAIVLVPALLLPAVLLPRDGVLWPLALAAPGLGMLGLAGAWPAAAGTLGQSPWRRAALGGLGWVWLAPGGALLGHGLYLRQAAGAHSTSTWIASPTAAVHDVLTPILTSGVLTGGLAWALAAAAVPWLGAGRVNRSGPRWPRALGGRGRGGILIVRAGLWAGLTLAAVLSALAALHRPSGGVVGASALLGGAAGALLVCLLHSTPGRRTLERAPGFPPELP